MSSLFDVGKSAVQSYRQALAVTGQNIANINTEGYKRRTADLEEVSGSQGGITSLANQSGLGVRVNDIRRAFDGFLLNRSNTANSNLQKADVFLNNLQQLEDALLPSKGGLGEQIGRFFSALSDAAAAPTDLASRAVAIEVGKSLAASFNGLANQLDQFQAAAVDQVSTGASELSLLSKELAAINAKILSSGQSGQTPNALMDLRDRTITEMSQLTSLTVDYSDLGAAKISIGVTGNGPILVDGSSYKNLGFASSFGKIQVTVGSGANLRPTSQIDSGKLSGAIEAYALTTDLIDELNNLAFLVSSEVNMQHGKGIDLDGKIGKPMFSTFGLAPQISPSASPDLRVEAEITDPAKLPIGTMRATYDKDKGVWTLDGPNLDAPVIGKDLLRGPGFTLTITGEPRNADYFELNRATSAAQSIKFILSKPQEIAASSLLTSEASVKNTSDASLDAQLRDQVRPEDPMDVSKVLKNSISPLEATNFIANGLVGVVPAGTPNATIASFSKQSTAKFQLQSLILNNLQQLTFQRANSNNDGPHTFNISYATAHPNASSSSKWLDASEVAKLLNSGVLRSNAGLSLADLGIYAAGSGGSLTLASASGNFSSDAAGIARISAGVASVDAIVSDAMSASEFQIFTREGRHIAGSPLTQEEITNLITADNGFSREASYQADYLNDELNSYRGMGLNVSQAGGMYRIETGSNGVFAYSEGGTSFVPASTTAAHDLTLTVSNGETTTIAVQNGASAKHVAEAANLKFNQLGVRAEARLVMELFDFQSGKLDFSFESENRMPIRIISEITNNDVTNLALEINQVTGQTGVIAKLSSDKKRIILESKSGEDIVFSSLAETSPLFSARIVDSDNIPAIRPLGSVSATGSFGNLDLATTTLTATNINGEGKNATFDVTLVNGALTVSLNQLGNGYQVGDKMLIKGSALGGLDGVNDLTLTVDAIDSSSLVALGSGVGENRISSARFSGQLFFSASHSFNIVSPSETKLAQQDAEVGGMVSVDSNLTGDIKTIDFEVNPDIDQSLGSSDGIAAVAASAQYHLSVPASFSAVNFSATVSADKINPLSKEKINKALLSALREQAPLSSLSGNSAAAAKQIVKYGFVGNEPVNSLTDSVNVSINGISVAVDLRDIDGSQTAATDAEDVTTAIVNAVNVANLGIVASKEFNGGTYQVVLTSAQTGLSFSVESFVFNDAANAGSPGSLSLVSTQSARALPSDGSSLSLSYEGKNYDLTMQSGEIVVTGGEPGRITAYYDANAKLQVFGGGSLAGANITVTSDTVVSGNQASAVLFGLDDNTTRFTSSVVTLDNGLPQLNLKFNGNDVAVSLANDGTVTVTPVTAALTARWEAATNTTGRLVFEYDAAVNTLSFEKPSDNLGFKVTDHTVGLFEDKIRVVANDGAAFKVTVDATSMAGSVVKMTDMANQDLLVIFTGTGAKSLGAVFDEPVAHQETDEIKVKVINESGSLIELFDANTGHSIATRTLANGRAEFNNMDLRLFGNAELNDEFAVKLNVNGGGDARNLEKIIELQFSDVNGAESGGFQKVFGTIVAEIGESVRSGEIALEAADASRNAAEEAEAEFSGVNLDEEAASLLEFQQAYQASARILSTARELFRSLIEVV